MVFIGELVGETVWPEIEPESDVKFARGPSFPGLHDKVLVLIHQLQCYTFGITLDKTLRHYINISYQQSQACYIFSHLHLYYN